MTSWTTKAQVTKEKIDKWDLGIFFFNLGTSKDYPQGKKATQIMGEKYL